MEPNPNEGVLPMRDCHSPVKSESDRDSDSGASSASSIVSNPGFNDPEFYAPLLLSQRRLYASSIRFMRRQAKKARDEAMCTAKAEDEAKRAAKAEDEAKRTAKAEDEAKRTAKAEDEAKRAAIRDEEDPIVAEFPIFIKPGLEGDRQFIVMQFPNRERNKPYDAKNGCAPLELRIKPNAGMVELDVPINVHHNYDRVKGIKWGEAMNKSVSTKGSGSHGLPGGFGIGGAPQAGRGRGRGEVEEVENQEKLLGDYNKAVDDGHVLGIQTLGGQFVAKKPTSPIYMAGTFSNGQLHLVPVDQVVSLRPQFHHIDAANEQDRLSRARDAGAAPRATEARAVHMTVKTPGEGEDDHGDNMNKRVQDVQAESWRRHRVIDAETEESWGFFQENFFVGGAMGQNTKELSAKVPQLISGVSDEHYLDMISAPIDPARLKKAREAEKEARKEARQARRSEVKNGKGKEVVRDFDDSSDTLSETESVEATAKAVEDDETATA